MKLIIKEYLAGLRERNELDAVLTDLISHMGLNIFSTPARGTTQHGVDIAAVGSLNGGIEKVYLLTIKSGDLGRTGWNDGSPQSLRPSIDDIIDAYITTLIPSAHKNKKIVICLCFGGDILENVRASITGYISELQNKRPNIEFEEWNGDKIAELILSNFLQEDLMPKHSQSQLRKSVAFSDNTEISYDHFKKLLLFLKGSAVNKKANIITVLRQMNISLWILFTWARDRNNIESAYLAAELTLLYAWEISKNFIAKKDKASKAINQTFQSLLKVYFQIVTQYLDKIIPHIENMHGISSAVRSSNGVDINLKLFDLLGRLSIHGVWVKYLASNKDLQIHDDPEQQVILISSAIKTLISNNPVLLLPLKDDQAIDISLALLIMGTDQNNHTEIKRWLHEMIDRANLSYMAKSNYPCNIYSYADLLEHPKQDDPQYFENVTSGSLLYPMISLWSALLGDIDLFNKVKLLKENYLKHCNFQLWYPDETSEKHFYCNTDLHGATLSDVGIQLSPENLLAQIFTECEKLPNYKEMSAVRLGFWPLILLGCRHYRLPIPLHIMEPLWLKI